MTNIAFAFNGLLTGASIPSCTRFCDSPVRMTDRGWRLVHDAFDAGNAGLVHDDIAEPDDFGNICADGFDAHPLAEPRALMVDAVKQNGG